MLLKLYIFAVLVYFRYYRKKRSRFHLVL